MSPSAYGAHNLPEAPSFFVDRLNKEHLSHYAPSAPQPAPRPSRAPEEPAPVNLALAGLAGGFLGWLVATAAISAPGISPLLAIAAGSGIGWVSASLMTGNKAKEAKTEGEGDSIPSSLLMPTPSKEEPEVQRKFEVLDAEPARSAARPPGKKAAGIFFPRPRFALRRGGSGR